MDETLNTVEQGCVEDFLSGKETAFPPDLAPEDEMLFCALRQVSIEGREGREGLRGGLSDLEGKISELTDIILGVLPDRSNGLMGQIKVNTRFRKTIQWVLSAVGLAFLGGAGIWAWGVLVP